MARTLERALDALTPRSLRLTLALVVGLMACLPVVAWHDSWRGPDTEDAKGPRVTQATLVAPTATTSPLPLARPAPAVINPAGLDLQGLAWLYVALVSVALLLALGALHRLRAFRLAVENAVLQRTDDILAHHRPPAELAPVAHMVDRLMWDFRYMAGQMRTVADDGAHAMRTPLATVATALHSIRRHLPADDVRAQRTLRIIDLSIDRLSQLVDATQVQGQSIAALVAAPRQRFEFAALVDAAVARAGTEAAERRIAVRFDRAAVDHACILANREALEIAVRDLLLSALDSSPEEGAVEVTLATDHAATTLVVADVGHDDFDVALLFEQEPALLAPEGQPTPRWPGLSGVRRTVEIMGGTVTAWRNAAGGVSVSLSLPTASAG